MRLAETIIIKILNSYWVFTRVKTALTMMKSAQCRLGHFPQKYDNRSVLTRVEKGFTNSNNRLPQDGQNLETGVENE